MGCHNAPIGTFSILARRKSAFSSSLLASAGCDPMMLYFLDSFGLDLHLTILAPDMVGTYGPSVVVFVCAVSTIRSTFPQALCSAFSAARTFYWRLTAFPLVENFTAATLFSASLTLMAKSWRANAIAFSNFNANAPRLAFDSLTLNCRFCFVSWGGFKFRVNISTDSLFL